MIIHLAKKPTKTPTPPGKAKLVALCTDSSCGNEIIPLYLSGTKRRSTLGMNRYELTDVLSWRNYKGEKRYVILPHTEYEARCHRKNKRMRLSMDNYEEELKVPVEAVRKVKYLKEPQKPIIYMEGVASEVSRNQASCTDC